MAVKLAAVAGAVALLTWRARPGAAARAHAAWRLVLLAPPVLLAGSLAVTPAVLVLPDARVMDAASPAGVLRLTLSGWGAALPASPGAVAGVVYAGVAALLLGRLAVDLLAVRRLIRSSAPIASDIERDARAILAPHVSIRQGTLRVPVTAGVRRPIVLLPSDWPSLSALEQEAVLRHEDAHVRRRDYAWGVAVSALCALVWFHPAMWAAARRTRWFAELASDHAAARAVGATAYADALAGLAQRWREVRTARHAAAIGAHSRVVPRLHLLLDRPSPCRGAATMAALVVAGGGLAASPALRVQIDRPSGTAAAAPADASDRWVARGSHDHARGHARRP
jgi:beta-lactamase regulating signal transducer with metallopeptidase domain